LTWMSSSMLTYIKAPGISTIATSRPSKVSKMAVINIASVETVGE